ncbi:MAG: hypothetical protein C5B56_12275 [Proteobacteria bacterium]|nr:MAG: hypothetical protein C5B56_12275 [Pseudomonadota bacterium]
MRGSAPLAGQDWAFKEIDHRLAGKPLQRIEHSDTDDRTNIVEFTDAELDQIIRERLQAEGYGKQRPEGDSLD